MGELSPHTRTGEKRRGRWHIAFLLDRYFSWLVASPPMLILVVVAVVPFLIMLSYSFTDFSFTLPGHDGNFIGFDNFGRALGADDRLKQSVWTTVCFVGIAVPVEFALGLAIALLIHKSRLGRGLLIPLISLPVVIAPVTTGLVWRLLLHGDYGPVGYYVQSLGLLGGGSLLGSPASAFWAVVLIDVWQWTPFFVIVLTAGLETLPKLPHESAAVDGASEWQILHTVTLPLLRRTMLVALLFRFMDALKEFDKVFVMTHGGPAAATEFLSIYAWTVAFEHGDLGYASAITLLMFISVLVTCNVLLWFGRGELRRWGRVV